MLRSSLLFLLLISIFLADAVPIATHAPMQYVVKAADVQWDLANKYLPQPWRWPELCSDKIYIGDTLVLKISKNSTHLIVNHGPNSNYANALVPPLPLKLLGPFLNQSTALSPDEFGALPYVVALDQGLSVATTGDIILGRALPNPSIKQNFLVLRKKRDYINPDDIYKTLGIEADYIATAHVTKLGESTYLQLTQVYQQVQIGDRLVPSQTNVPTLQFNLQAPPKPVRAQIIASLIDYAAINKYSLVALNYGSEAGAVPGQILLVTSEMSTKKPTGKPIGTLVIFRTFPTISWAMVMQMSAQIQVLNGVQSP